MKMTVMYITFDLVDNCYFYKEKDKSSNIYCDSLF